MIRGFTSDSAADIGFVYILESIGSLIGGLLFTFVLISRFKPFTITLIFNCILFLNLFLLCSGFLIEDFPGEEKSSSPFYPGKDNNLPFTTF